jgi:hypothetical protein
MRMMIDERLPEERAGNVHLNSAETLTLGKAAFSKGIVSTPGADELLMQAFRLRTLSSNLSLVENPGVNNSQGT